MNVEKLKDLTTEQITELWKGNLEIIYESQIFAIGVVFSNF